MSQEWVLRTLSRLQKYNPIPEYGSIEKLVRNDMYRARLFRMLPIGEDKIQITMYKVKNKGMKSFDTIIETKLKPITMNKPQNNFEKDVLESYNRCRRKAIHKYLPRVEKKKIEKLMHDNYLQVKDF